MCVDMEGGAIALNLLTDTHNTRTTRKFLRFLSFYLKEQLLSKPLPAPAMGRDFYML